MNFLDRLKNIGKPQVVDVSQQDMTPLAALQQVESQAANFLRQLNGQIPLKEKLALMSDAFRPDNAILSQAIIPTSLGNIDPFGVGHVTRSTTKRIEANIEQGVEYFQNLAASLGGESADIIEQSKATIEEAKIRSRRGRQPRIFSETITTDEYGNIIEDRLSKQEAAKWAMGGVMEAFSAFRNNLSEK